MNKTHEKRKGRENKIFKNFANNHRMPHRTSNTRNDYERKMNYDWPYKTGSEKCLYHLCIIWGSWWYNIKRFLSYSKNYICNFMQAKAWQIIPLQFDLLNLESVKNKRKKIQKFEYLENEKRFLDEIKNIFHSFLKGSHLVKKIKS